MAQEDDLRALGKIMDFLRAVSIMAQGEFSVDCPRTTNQIS